MNNFMFRITNRDIIQVGYFVYISDLLNILWYCNFKLIVEKIMKKIVTFGLQKF